MSTQYTDYVSSEESLAAALRPFGWTCTEDFWRRYYTDPWVFNLANAIERMAFRVAELEARIDGSRS